MFFILKIQPSSFTIVVKRFLWKRLRINHKRFQRFQERPLVLDRHRTVVGDVDVTRHLRVVEDASKVDDVLLEGQVWKINLSFEGDIILKEEEGTKPLKILMVFLILKSINAA